MNTRRFPISVRRLYKTTWGGYIKMWGDYIGMMRFEEVILTVFDNTVLGRPLLGPAIINFPLYFSCDCILNQTGRSEGDSFSKNIITNEMF